MRQTRYAYIYMCVYIYIYEYTCIYVYVFAYLYTCMRVCVYEYLNIELLHSLQGSKAFDKHCRPSEQKREKVTMPRLPRCLSSGPPEYVM